MLDESAINSRLHQMQVEADPELIWDETCEGSARALVIFVGPSPGGDKPVERRPMNKSCSRALWNESFDKPPLVESRLPRQLEAAGRGYICRTLRHSR